MTETATASETKTLKDKLRSILDENDRIGAAIKIEDSGGVVVSKEQAETYRKNLGDAREIKALIDDLEGGAELKRWLEEPAGTPSLAVAKAAAEQGIAIHRDMPKSLGEMFTDSLEFKALVASGSRQMAAPWEIEGQDITKLGTFGQKDVYRTSGGTLQGPGFGAVQYDPLVPRNFRRARVRDLFPVAKTNANLIDFFRVLGFGANRLDLTSSASPVADRDEANTNFALKPKSSLTFETAQAPVRTIAHYEVAHRNVLQDEPQLQSTINNELLYGLRLEEDRQILLGTGSGEDLTGILNTAGVQDYAISSGPATDTKADALRRAATLVILAYFDPTGIVIHPFDWEDIELTKTTGTASSGEYIIAMSVTLGAQAQLWRMPVIDSPAMTEGRGLVGAFGLGAQLYDREAANIRIAEQHEDLFVRNAVAILAEERLALAVKRPESFVDVDLT